MTVLRLALVISVFATACTGDSTPAAPTAATATSLSISGVDAVRTGLFAYYTVTATLSDGTTRAVTPTWTSSNTGVAEISDGYFVGVAHGSTNLTASHEGRSVSKTVQVVNNYGGNWAGTYVVRACNDSGIYRDGVFGDGIYSDVPWCQAFNGVGSVHSITLALSQMGSNQSEIRGALGEGTADLTGVVTADGRLNLGGTLSLLDFDGEIVVETLHVGAWDTNLSGPGVMTGRWSENLVSVGRVGNVYSENELVTMTQTSASANPASATQ